MKKIFVVLTSILIASGGLISTSLAHEVAEVHFFFSETCPHCHAEAIFLDDLQEEYGAQLDINRYSVNEKGTYEKFQEIAVSYNAEETWGVVPITFVGDRYFIGFTNSQGPIAQGIVQEIENMLVDANSASTHSEEGPTEQSKTISVPFIGEIDPSQHSLSTLAIILGALDGFNVCSLGALILILGLTLQLKSRRKIMTYGGIFLLTTALIYGLLITFWYKLFAWIGGQLGVLNLIIGLIGIGGGIYFLKEFLRLRKVGMICETTGASFVDKVTKRAEEAFQNPRQVVTLALAIAAFAAVIAIVEFPCSAAIPVVFAGILAEQGITGIGYLLLMGLFLLFYLIDEILIFAIAAWQMRLVFTSPNLTIWATFLETLLLLTLGTYYLIAWF